VDTNWLQAIFCITERVILCRIITQVAPLIPAWGKKLQTSDRLFRRTSVMHTGENTKKRMCGYANLWMSQRVML